MFPFAGFKRTELGPAPLPETVQIEFTFIDGPFDGHKSIATVGCVMSDIVTVTMKRDGKKYLYRYAGEDAFRFEKELE